MNGEEQTSNYTSSNKSTNNLNKTLNSSSKYRMKRPFSMVSNLSNLDCEIPYSNKKFKNHSNFSAAEHNNLNFQSESKKVSPVFSMNCTSDVDMMQASSSSNNNIYSYANDQKR